MDITGLGSCSTFDIGDAIKEFVAAVYVCKTLFIFF
jgi:hypothetical protein